MAPAISFIRRVSPSAQRWRRGVANQGGRPECSTPLAWRPHPWFELRQAPPADSCVYRAATGKIRYLLAPPEGAQPATPFTSRPPRSNLQHYAKRLRTRVVHGPVPPAQRPRTQPAPPQLTDCGQRTVPSAPMPPAPSKRRTPRVGRSREPRTHGPHVPPGCVSQVAHACVCVQPMHRALKHGAGIHLPAHHARPMHVQSHRPCSQCMQPHPNAPQHACAWLRHRTR